MPWSNRARVRPHLHLFDQLRPALTRCRRLRAHLHDFGRIWAHLLPNLASNLPTVCDLGVGRVRRTHPHAGQTDLEFGQAHARYGRTLPHLSGRRGSPVKARPSVAEPPYRARSWSSAPSRARKSSPSSSAPSVWNMGPARSARVSARLLWRGGGDGPPVYSEVRALISRRRSRVDGHGVGSCAYASLDGEQRARAGEDRALVRKAHAMPISPTPLSQFWVQACPVWRIRLCDKVPAARPNCAIGPHLRRPILPQESLSGQRSMESGKSEVDG